MLPWNFQNSKYTFLDLHPRQDKRHITEKDVATISALAEVASSQVALNIEGDIRDDIMRMVLQYNTTQFTVVPVQEGEKTTERGFNPEEKRQEIGLEPWPNLASAFTNASPVNTGFFCTG